MTLTLRPAFAAALLAAALSLSSAAAAERLAVGVSHVRDGSCGDGGRTYLDAAYERAGGPFEARAEIRAAPSGGDCREEAVSYSLELERSWPLAGRLQGLAKFTAAERAQTSPYAQAGADGAPLLRPDGQALFAVHLPSGTARTVGGVLGASLATAAGEIDIGINLVPQPFALGDERTLHLGWTLAAGGFAFRAAAEAGGPETLLDAGASWTRGNIQIAVSHARGLNALTDGAPPVQEIGGARFFAAGAPRGSATTLSIRYAIDL